MKRTYIVVDFDGTIVEHKYPEIGNIVPGALVCLKWLQSEGCLLILNTMRSDNRADGRNVLAEAVKFLADNGIELYGVNDNPDQHSWTSSPKIYGHAYIDDAAIGCPLVYKAGERPYVDWYVTRRMLEIQLNRLAQQHSH